ncbi:MAG: phenylalanine--tRNA ligase subunit beta [Pseudomonadota bacterium]
MKILLSDLQRYLPSINKGNINILNRIGYEIDSINDIKEKLQNFIVGQIISCKKIEGANKLNLCMVHDGNEDLQIICGAANVKPGLKVVLAKIGVVMPDGMMIKKAKIRNVTSYGMLCSSEELGLSNDNKGILELPENAIVGKSIVSWIACDTIVDIDITPDKIFANSLIGMAADIARSDQFKLDRLHTTGQKIDIELIECNDHASAAYWLNIKNIKNIISPNWLRDKLYFLGLKSHNFLVDILNYITYMTGQPLHVYDADKIFGKLRICNMQQQIDFIGLDDKKYNVENGDLVICDENNQICAIAGVIGSKATSVNLDTRNIIIEIAAFDRQFFNKYPLNISKAYRLFNKGVLGANVYSVLEYIVYHLNNTGELNMNSVLNQDLSVYGWHYNKLINRKILFDINMYEGLIGVAVDKKRFMQLFSSNGFSVNQVSEFVYEISVPENRFDIVVEQDIITEYLRFSDYSTLPLKNIRHDFNDDMVIGKNSIFFRVYLAKLLARLGYDEVMSWSFGNKEENQLLSQNIVEIQNPISSNLSVLNVSNYSNLLSIANENLSRLEDGFKFFTIAPLFKWLKKVDGENIDGNSVDCENKIQQIYHLSGIVHLKEQNKFHNKVNVVDFYDVKGDIENFLSELGFNNVIFKHSDDKEVLYSNPYQTVRIFINAKQELGYITVLYPQNNLLFFELNIDVLFAFFKQKKKAIIIDKHPVFRDFCFVINREENNDIVGDIINTVRRVNNVTSVELIDDHVVNKTIAIRVRMESMKSMTKEDISKVEKCIVADVYSKLGVSLKDV